MNIKYEPYNFSQVWRRHFKLKYLLWVKQYGPVKSNRNTGLLMNCKINAVRSCEKINVSAWGAECCPKWTKIKRSTTCRLLPMLPNRLCACAAALPHMSISLPHNVNDRAGLSSSSSFCVCVCVLVWMLQWISRVWLCLLRIIFENLCPSPLRVAQANPSGARKTPWLAHLRPRFRGNVNHESRFSSCSS
jgi:hypothetical protein